MEVTAATFIESEEETFGHMAPIVGSSTQVHAASASSNENVDALEDRSLTAASTGLYEVGRQKSAPPGMETTGDPLQQPSSLARYTSADSAVPAQDPNHGLGDSAAQSSVVSRGRSNSKSTKERRRSQEPKERQESAPEEAEAPQDVLYEEEEVDSQVAAEAQSNDWFASAHELLWQAAQGSQLCLTLTEGSLHDLGIDSGCLEAELPASLVMDLFSSAQLGSNMVQPNMVDHNAMGSMCIAQTMIPSMSVASAPAADITYPDLMYQQYSDHCDYEPAPFQASTHGAIHGRVPVTATAAEGMYWLPDSTTTFPAAPAAQGFSDASFASSKQCAELPAHPPSKYNSRELTAAPAHPPPKYSSRELTAAPVRAQPVASAIHGSFAPGSAHRNGQPARQLEQPAHKVPPAPQPPQLVDTTPMLLGMGDIAAPKHGAAKAKVRPPNSARGATHKRREPGSRPDSKPKDEASSDHKEHKEDMQQESQLPSLSARDSTLRTATTGTAPGSQTARYSRKLSSDDTHEALVPTSKAVPEDLYIYTGAPRDSHDIESRLHSGRSSDVLRDVFGEEPLSLPLPSASASSAHRLGSTPQMRDGRSARLLAGLQQTSSTIGHRPISGNWPSPGSVFGEPVVLGGRRKPGTAPAGATRDPWVSSTSVDEDRMLSGKGSMKMLGASDSSRTFGTQLTSNSSVTSLLASPGQRPHTSPQQGVVQKRVRESRWRRAREQQWDGSAAASSSGFSSVACSSSASTVASRSQLGCIPFLNAHDLAIGKARIEEMAAMVAATPSTPSLPSRPLTRDKNKMDTLQSQVVLNMSLVGYEDWKTEISHNNCEWCGSVLHSAYLQCAEIISSRRAHSESSQRESTEAHELMSMVISDSHVQLRELVDSGGNFGPDVYHQDKIEHCRLLVGAVLEETQLPKAFEEVVIDGTAVHEDEEGRGRARRAAANQISVIMDASRALLAYRDATACVVHGLSQHERLLELLQKERDMGIQAAEDGEQLNPRSLQLSRIGGALARGIDLWRRRYPEKWLTHSSASTINLPHRVFLWRGIDALERIRGDSASAKLPPLNLAASISSLHSASSALGADSFSVFDFQESPPQPQNSSARAALDGTRGLRALLRSSKPNVASRAPSSRGSQRNRVPS